MSKTWAHAHLPPGSTVRQTGLVATFHFGGALSTTEVSDIWRHPLGKELQMVTTSLTTPGSTDTVLDVMRNGDVIVSITLVALEDYAEAFMIEPFKRHDKLTVQTPTVGTGAEGIVVHCIFSQ